MDFDEIKRPTRDFTVRSTKLGQEDRQAIQDARDERDRGKEAENTNYEKNKETLIQKKADELAEKQRLEPKPKPPGSRELERNPIRFEHSPSWQRSWRIRAARSDR
jgi:hypothetical protein